MTEEHRCRFCGQKVVDGSEESGYTGDGPDWMTQDGDFGCDQSPESLPGDGVGNHAVTPAEEQRAYRWADESAPEVEHLNDRALVIFYGRNSYYMGSLYKSSELRQEILRRLQGYHTLLEAAKEAHDEADHALGSDEDNPFDLLEICDVNLNAIKGVLASAIKRSER